jgi:hypothetical protein
MSNDAMSLFPFSFFLSSRLISISYGLLTWRRTGVWMLSLFFCMCIGISYEISSDLVALISLHSLCHYRGVIGMREEN